MTEEKIAERLRRKRGQGFESSSTSDGKHVQCGHGHINMSMRVAISRVSRSRASLKVVIPVRDRRSKCAQKAIFSC